MLPTLWTAQQEAENLTTYKILIQSSPKLRKRQSKLTPNFCNLPLCSIRSPQPPYSATDVKGRKTNLERNLRLFLNFIADPKHQFIHLCILSGTGKFFAGGKKKKNNNLKTPHLLQTLMLLADRAAQPSLGSHFLLTCNKHKSFLFRWNIFYLKASKRQERKPKIYPCPACILATNTTDLLSSPFQRNSCCVWCPVLQVHHTGLLNQLNCFRESLHLLQSNSQRDVAVRSCAYVQWNKSKQTVISYFLRFWLLFTNL